MALPNAPLSFSDLRRVLGPNDENSFSLGQCRPNYAPAYGDGVPGVTDNGITLSQFQGKSKLNKGFTFRAFQGSAYTFTVGAGGAAGARNGGYNSAGGGGAGILVNGGGGGGGTGGGIYYNSGTNYSMGGNGGTGYGAGGGGAVWKTDLKGLNYTGSQAAGGGAGGFIYISINGSELFTASSTPYNCTSSGTMLYIIMGGGGGGGGSEPFGSIGSVGGGGGAGSLNYGTFSVISGDSLTLNVGGTTSIVNGSTTLASAAAGGGGAKSAGGGGGVANGGGINAAGGGGGSGSQGSSYVNNAISSVASLGGYFADNPALFSTYNAFATGITTNMTNLTSATNSTYTVNGSATNFSVEWTGKFYAPTTGSYTFYLGSGDASYLWIGPYATSGYTTANANANNGGIHDIVNVTYTTVLTGGTLYPMRIQYGQSTGLYDCQFSFSGPNISRIYLLTNYVYT
jgi:hypothetical protein